MEKGEEFLGKAIELAYNNIEKGGRPFGAVVVKNGEVIASGVNQILTTNDPTAHAELLAIRAASQVLGSANLESCSVYASGHPCPMCMAAMRLAGIKSVSYAYSNEDGTTFGLSTAEICIELAKPFAEQSMKIQYIPIRVENRTDLYVHWKNYQANHSGSE
ncbi:hypothetical protein ACL9Z5_002345 [Acinetobacter calcoaceticus]|jgi:tRNA(Arg) A34 adenosine deaminase TadA